MPGIFSSLVLIPCLTTAGFYLYSIRGASDLFSSRGEQGPDFTPPVSILKPLCGLESDTYENLASFCRQDYPQHQILFGVAQANDPAVEVVKQIIRDFPERDIELVICAVSRGTNPKVSSLIQMQAKAKHPFVLLSDSDIWVKSDYVRHLMRSFGDSSVGALTCMGRSRTKGFPSILEALRVATDFCAGVLVARKLEGVKFGLGSTIALRREALEAIGGFSAISDYLADDFQLGALINKAGWKVLLSDYVVEHRFARMTLAQIIRRQSRWAKGIRVSRPLSYGGLFFTQGTPLSVLFLALTRGSFLGWAVLAATWSARLAAAYIIGARFLRDRTVKRFLWLAPVQDLVGFVVWCANLFGSAVDWRGERFRLTRNGKLIPV